MKGPGISAILIVPTCTLSIAALHAFTNSSPALFVLMTLSIRLIVVLGLMHTAAATGTAAHATQTEARRARI